MCVKQKLTKAEAKMALKRRMDFRGKQYVREKRIYHCMFCDAWHLTSQEEPSFEIRSEEISNDGFKKYLEQ